MPTKTSAYTLKWKQQNFKSEFFVRIYSGNPELKLYVFADGSGQVR